MTYPRGMWKRQPGRNWSQLVRGTNWSSSFAREDRRVRPRFCTSKSWPFRPKARATELPNSTTLRYLTSLSDTKLMTWCFFTLFSRKMKKTSFADKSSQKETSWILVTQILRCSISTLPWFSMPFCLFDLLWRTEQGSNWRQPLSPPWWGTHLHRWCAACNLWKLSTKQDILNACAHLTLTYGSAGY